MSERGSSALHAILLDIEGTIAPIAFVYDVLFPYARAHLRDHVERHAASPDYAPLFDRLRDEHDADVSRGEPAPAWVDAPRAARLASVVRYCEWLMHRDRKSTSLKTLQGRIWEEGYGSGTLVGQVFADVLPALQHWRARDLAVGIFSSGSVLAQQLLLRHSSAGDLTPFVRWYFDTTVGAKGESDSYRRIAREMAAPVDAVVFVSDITRELDAARAAGMRTVLSTRPGNALPPPAHGYPVIQSFADLPL